MMTHYCTCQIPLETRNGSSETHLRTNDKLQGPVPNGHMDTLESVADTANNSFIGPGTDDAGEDNVLSIQDKFQQNTAKLTAYYIEHCTLHGLHYIFQTKSIIRKLMWFLILLTGAGLCFNEIKVSFHQYFEFPFRTQSTEEYPKKLSLPAVSICIFKDVRPSLRNRSGGQNFRMVDVETEAVGYLREYLISCRLEKGVRNGEICNANNFTAFISSSGQTCYTLNSGQEGYELLEVDNVGPEYGLRIVLNTHEMDDGGDSFRGIGLRIILHQQRELPLKRVGFHVSPGYVTYVDIRKQKVKNLPKPFSTNCSGRDLKMYKKYSRSNCFLEELTKYVQERCGCRGWFMPGADQSNGSVCNPQRSLDCLWPVWEEFEQLNEYDCPVDCEIFSYEAQLSSALFLPDRRLPLGKHAWLKPPKNMPNETDAMVQFISDNYVVLSIFYSVLRLDVTQQEPAYGLYRLVGDVGGQLGLVLGASSITLLEVIDLLVFVIIYWLQAKYHSWRRR